MHTTLSMAISANGIIARENGEEDFLSEEHWVAFRALAASYGNFIIGRKTYEAVRGWEDHETFDDIPDVDRIVLTRDGAAALAPGYTRASSPDDALSILEEHGYTRALVTGGAQVNADFLRAGLLNEIVLSIEPALMGRGIPLIAPLDTEVRLTLLASSAAPSGIVTLRYGVEHVPPRA